MYFVDVNKNSKYPRFRTNNPYPFECLHELKSADRLIITKSRKDTILLRKLLKQLPFEPELDKQYIVTNFTSEGIRLNDKWGDTISKMYDKIYTLTDFDLQGVSCGNYHRKHYGFIPLFLTNGRFNTKDHGAKDISDLVKLNGYDNVKQLLKQWND